MAQPVSVDSINGVPVASVAVPGSGKPKCDDYKHPQWCWATDGVPLPPPQLRQLAVALGASKTVDGYGTEFPSISDVSAWPDDCAKNSIVARHGSIFKWQVQVPETVLSSSSSSQQQSQPQTASQQQSQQQTQPKTKQLSFGATSGGTSKQVAAAKLVAWCDDRMAEHEKFQEGAAEAAEEDVLGWPPKVEELRKLVEKAPCGQLPYPSEVTQTLQRGKDKSAQRMERAKEQTHDEFLLLLASLCVIDHPFDPDGAKGPAVAVDTREFVHNLCHYFPSKQVAGTGSSGAPVKLMSQGQVAKALVRLFSVDGAGTTVATQVFTSGGGKESGGKESDGDAPSMGLLFGSATHPEHDAKMTAAKAWDGFASDRMKPPTTEAELKTVHEAIKGYPQQLPVAMFTKEELDRDLELPSADVAKQLKSIMSSTHQVVRRMGVADKRDQKIGETSSGCGADDHLTPFEALSSLSGCKDKGVNVLVLLCYHLSSEGQHPIFLKVSPYLSDSVNERGGGLGGGSGGGGGGGDGGGAGKGSKGGGGSPWIKDALKTEQGTGALAASIAAGLAKALGWAPDGKSPAAEAAAPGAAGAPPPEEEPQRRRVEMIKCGKDLLPAVYVELMGSDNATFEAVLDDSRKREARLRVLEAKADPDRSDKREMKVLKMRLQKIDEALALVEGPDAN